MSRVDVVVPCYEYGRYLERCLDSILTQRDVAVRVLVIDDASTDCTPHIATDRVQTDDRVEYRRHSTNLGHIATYNEGLLGWATGDYVALVSADDILAPGALARSAQVMDAHPTVGMVYGRPVAFHDESTIPDAKRRSLGLSVWDGHTWIAHRCRAGHNVITAPEVVVRRSVQQAVGGYVEHLPHAGDLEMWLRIASVADVAYVKGAPQAYHRVHSQSMQRSRFANSLVDLQQRQEAFDEFFRMHGHRVETSDALQAMARRALAKEALWRACRAYDRDRIDCVPVDDLVQFAFNAFPAAYELREYAALKRRRLLGSTFCTRTQIFAAPAIARRVRSGLRRQRWQRTGE